MNKRYLICFLITTGISINATAGQLIKSTDYGEKWPFTVKEGVLDCPDGQTVIFISGDKKYAANGAAKSRGYAAIESIWRDDPSMLKMQKEIAKSENKTLQQIQKEMGPMPKVNIGPIINAGIKLCN